MTDSPEISISFINIALFGGVVIGSIWSWTKALPETPDTARRIPWLPWNLSLLHILLLAWIVVMIILVVPHIAHSLVSPFVSGSNTKEQMEIISATFFTQIAFLGTVLYALHLTRNSTTEFFFRSVANANQLSLYTVRIFLRYLPLVWLVGLFWGGLLLLLDYLGTPVKVEPQMAAEWIAQSQSLVFLATMAILVVIVAPITEEILFRGFLYRVLSEKFSARAALIVTSFLFALIHASLHGLLPLFFLGMLLAKSYEETRDIRVPILFHAIFNGYSFLHLITFPSLN